MPKIKLHNDVEHNGKRYLAGSEADTDDLNIDDEALDALVSVNAVTVVADSKQKPVANKKADKAGDDAAGAE